MTFRVFVLRQSSFRLDYEGGVSSVSPSSSLSDQITKMTFRVFALRQSTFRLDYEDGVPSSDQITKMTFRVFALRQSTFRLDYEDDVPSSDQITKMTFGVFVLRQSSFRLDYEDGISSVRPSSERIQRCKFGDLTLISSFDTNFYPRECQEIYRQFIRFSLLSFAIISNDKMK